MSSSDLSEDLNCDKSTKPSLSFSLRRSIERTREKVLQNLGQGDKTQDEYIQLCESNFYKQCEIASKLQKALRSYISKVKIMAGASNKLFETVLHVYEDSWSCKKEISDSAKKSEISWVTYMNNFSRDVQQVVEDYNDQFIILKTKISRRERRQIELDSCKRTYEQLRSAKKIDEVKIQKASERLSAAVSAYQMITKELYDELPAFFDSRIGTLCDVLQALFNSDELFYQNLQTYSGDMASQIDKLRTEYKNGGLNMCRRPFPADNDILPGHYIPDSEIDVYETSDHLTSFSSSSQQNNGNITGPAKVISSPIPQCEGMEDECYETLDTASSGPSRGPITSTNSSIARHGSVSSRSGSTPKTESPTPSQKLSRSLSNTSLPSQESRQPVAREFLVIPSASEAQEDDEDCDDHVYAMPEKCVTKKGSVKANSSEPDKSHSLPRLMQAKHAYKPTAEDELAFEAKDILKILDVDINKYQETMQWLLAHNTRSDETGLAPINYLQNID